MKESMKKIRKLIHKTSDIVERQTKLYNGKEALQERGQWIDMEKMLSVKKVLDNKGWARMEGLQQHISYVGLDQLSKVSVCIKWLL